MEALIVLLILFYIIIFIIWGIHLLDNTSRNKYGFASFSTFKKIFKQHKWKINYYNELIDFESSANYISEFSIIFDDKGMCIYTPIQFLFTYIYILNCKHNYKHKKHYNRVNWKNYIDR